MEKSEIEEAKEYERDIENIIKRRRIGIMILKIISIFLFPYSQIFS